MAITTARKNFTHLVNRRLIKVTILIIASGVTLAMMLVPVSARQSSYQLKAGDVAPQSIQAPYALTYPSDVLTEEARQEAEQRVGMVFLPADPGLARKQLEMLRASLAFISTVRADAYATHDQKLSDLAALENIQLAREDAESVLSLSDARWQMVQQECLSALEQAMRDTIREDQVKEAQRRLPTLISFSLPQDLAVLVNNLTIPFVVPNSLYSADMTTIARQEARNRVNTITRSFAAGETIVDRGQIISPAQMEALITYGLIQRPNNTRDLLASFALVITMSGFVALYFNRRKMPAGESMRYLGLIALVFLVFLYAARLIIPNRTVMPYLFPLPAFGLTLASLFNVELGMFLSLVLSVLAAFGLPNSLDLTVYYTLSSMFGILMLGKGQRTVNFIFAGLGIGALGSTIMMAYRLTDSTSDLLGMGTLVGASFFNGIVSASITLILQFLFAQLLGLATSIQLLEISRPDHPLQQFILQNAPGSYQHSLQVAILAEQAAEKIGADTLLVRVGAIYHDAGKALNPSFYIENQVPGKLNPHDDLEPAVSAQTIIRHVLDGRQIARKHRMPSRIIDFIMEHHGTLITRYQYARALEEAGGDAEKVDLTLFRYPGPRPQSRETALLMLADGCQARARAELPQNEEEIRAIVRKVMEFCQREGQLDDTRLTLRDLNLISESFVNTLQNTYHPRIRYPEVPHPAGAVPAVLPEGSQPAKGTADFVPPAAAPLEPPPQPIEAPQLFKPKNKVGSK